MQKLLDIMIFGLLYIAAFYSCSSMTSEDMQQGGTIMITGTVSSSDSGSPVEGVKIMFNAFSQTGSTEPVNSQNVYTDSNGIYSIAAEDISTTVTCIITAEHPEYISEEKEIIVNWKGISYDAMRGTFYVNDCDFYLGKK